MADPVQFAEDLTIFGQHEQKAPGDTRDPYKD